MLKAGITGGIGSGKTTICQVFETLGIPVFYADLAARHLMEQDENLMAEIRRLFGVDIYKNGLLDRARISSHVFKDPKLLKQLNEIVHPATIQHARQWMDSQTSPYIIKEAAIFFETGSDKEMDVMVGVYAPEAIRIDRLLLRDKEPEEIIKEKISRQMNDAEKMKLCDHIILNDDQTAILPQVIKLHELFLKQSSVKS